MSDKITLTLTDAGDDIFAVVALLRSYFGLNLADARAMVTAVPAALPPLDHEAAASLADGLASLGATATDKPVAATTPEPEYAPEPEPAQVYDINFDSDYDYPPEQEYSPEPEHVFTPDPTPEPQNDDVADSGTGRYIFSLESCGPCKLMIVKIIKEALGWGLKEAKDLADEAPTTLELNVTDIDDLRTFVNDINEAGGRASFRPA